jgi:hypothetical protein
MVDLQINRAIRKIISDSRMVDANGKKKVLPKILNLRSPGKRPTPSFSSQGSKELNTTKARKIVKSQRNMDCFLQARLTSENQEYAEISGKYILKDDNFGQISVTAQANQRPDSTKAL